MECTKCKKSFNEPFELYDGTVACPYCGRALTDIKRFEVTAESEERFKLSETYFYRALELSNTIIGKHLGSSETEKAKTQWAQCIDNAVKHCRYAAALGHPKAIWRMGFYYDKDYTAVSSSEAQRCRIAYNFYSLLSGDTIADDVFAEPAELAISSDEMRRLRVRAANDLLAMLYTAPDALANIRKFNYETNRSALVRRFGSAIRAVGGERSMSGSDGGAGQGVKTLSACLGKTRVPLFGYFYVSKESLARLTDEKARESEDKRSETLYPVLRKNIYMAYFPCSRGRQVGDEYMEVYDTVAVLSDYQKNELGGYLCFANTNAANMPDRALPKAVVARLEKNGYDMFRTMINSQAADGSAYVSNGLTFYCDDVLRFVKLNKCSYSRALEALCDDIRENIGM